jgi:hypothetical protein
MRKHHWVIKCHGFCGIKDVADFERARIVVVHRDTDDCIRSVMRRLDIPEEEATKIVLDDLANLLPLQSTAEHISYENHGIGGINAALLVSRLVDLQVPMAMDVIGMITQKYSKESVRRFVATLVDDETTMRDERGILFHKDTLLQEWHIG